MLWFLTFCLIIATVFCYLTFAPFYLEINSSKNLYRIRFDGLAFANLIITVNSLKVDLWIAGWRKQFNLLTKPIREKQEEKSILSKRKNKPFRITFQKAKVILESFKVNKFCLNVDSGNLQLNGLLYPCFYWLSKYTNKPISINFINKNEVILELENNIARIAGSLIFNHFTFKKQRSWKTLMNYSAN